MSEVSQDVHLAVGEILGSTKHLVRAIDEMKTDIRDIRTEFRTEQAMTNARLTKVEQFMWRTIGVAVAASVVVPLAVTAVGWWLKL